MLRSRIVCVFVGQVLLSGSLWAQTSLQELERQLLPPAPEDAAERQPAEPGYLGLVGDDSEEAGKGVRVLSVQPAGPADRAGFQVGDLITHIDEQAVANLDQMARRLGPRRAGDQVTFQLVREGQARKLVTRLSQRPEPASPVGPPLDAPAQADPSAPAQVLPPPADPKPSVPPRAAPAGQATLGVSVQDVSADAQDRFGLPHREGALIASVVPNSPAAKAGLPVGGSIIAVDGQPVRSAAELIGIIGRSRPHTEAEIHYYFANQLQRRKVRLAERTPAAAPGNLPADAPPRANSPPRLFGEERPLLRKVERALEGILGNGAPLGGPFAQPSVGEPPLPAQPFPAGQPLGGLPAAEPPEPWRTEIQTLRTKVENLERRLAEMEAALRRDPR